ncbi:MAG TPA: hypothetical protein VJR89_20270 [Polyangiales bacterium]|nr:hypothetical protein [Polyangiales bacterium]
MKRAWLIASLTVVPALASAQQKADEDELSEEPEGDAPSGDESAEAEEAPPTPPPAPPAPPPPALAAPPPSPFVFTLKGQIAATMYVQDVPFASGNGNSTIFSPFKLVADKWLLGGDIRQSRLTFTMRGPAVLGTAIPTGVVEFDLGGGNQITTVPGAIASAPVRDAMGNVIGTAAVPVATSSAQGDESLLPRLRVAYVELNWGMGTNILRVGQFHNLLLPMIAASASHTGTPLGYGAGQLGWRSPGITYLHRHAFNEDTYLDIGVQMNRNSWLDNLPSCTTAMLPPTNPGCMPYGVSFGEASMLPQFEARVLLSGGKAESPWLLYAPNVWQVYAVGHWDRKDVSGVGNVAPPGILDVLDTLVAEVGFKLKLGPVLVAGNGWIGKNSGNVYGNLLQMQQVNYGDVSGMGGWGQLGFSISRLFSVWAFGGIDKPNFDDLVAARLTRVQNIQLSGMFAYTEGPLVIGLEYLYIQTKSNDYTSMPGFVTTTGASGSQIATTLAYSF